MFYPDVVHQEIGEVLVKTKNGCMGEGAWAYEIEGSRRKKINQTYGNIRPTETKSEKPRNRA